MLKSVLRKCPICGEIFNPQDTGQRKYCSAYCRIEGRKILQAKWQLAHPDYWRDLMRVRREAKREEKAKQSEAK